MVDLVQLVFQEGFVWSASIALELVMELVFILFDEFFFISLNSASLGKEPGQEQAGLIRC